MRMARRIRQSGDLSSDGETDVLGQCRPQRCSPLRNVVFHIGAFRHNIIRLTARVADKSIVLARITC